MGILTRSFAFNLAFFGFLGMLGLVWYLNTSPKQEKFIRNPAQNPYQKTIAASGIIEAVDRNIEVGGPESGLISDIFVEVGEEVEKDQPLFQLDPRELQAQLLLQQSNVKVAEASLARLQDQLKRLKEVSDPRAVSRDLVETRENDVKVAAAQLEADRAQVNQTQMLIERLTVRAPRDGEILQNNIRAGEYYSTIDSGPAMLLGNVAKLQVRVDIDEQNASRFKKGYPAVAFPKNNPDIEIPLEFSRIEPYVIPKKSLTGASNERVDTRVLQVLYTFKEKPDYQVFVGQQVDVFIHEAN